MKTIFADFTRKNTAMGNKQEYGTLALQRYLLINRKEPHTEKNWCRIINPAKEFLNPMYPIINHF